MESSNKNIISSFKVQEELNPDIWYSDGESYKMKPEVRISLLDIVKNYIEFVDIELDTVKGFDVEIYVQDTNEPHFASGVYSVLYNEWIVEPNKEEVHIDSKKILSKAKNWMEQIGRFEVDAKREEPDVVLDNIDKFKKKMKKYRGSGLEEKGEYSYENLTFKFLRRNGCIKKLHDVRNYLIDKNLTLEENVSNV